MPSLPQSPLPPDAELSERLYRQFHDWRVWLYDAIVHGRLTPDHARALAGDIERTAARIRQDFPQLGDEPTGGER